MQSQWGGRTWVRNPFFWAWSFFSFLSNYPAVSYFAKKHVPLKHTLMLHKIILEKFEIFLEKYNEYSPTGINNWEPYKFGGVEDILVLSTWSLWHQVGSPSLGRWAKNKPHDPRKWWWLMSADKSLAFMTTRQSAAPGTPLQGEIRFSFNTSWFQLLKNFFYIRTEILLL